MILLSAFAFALIQLGRYVEFRAWAEVAEQKEIENRRLRAQIEHVSYRLSYVYRAVHARDRLLESLAKETWQYLPAVEAVRMTFLGRIRFETDHLPDSLIFRPYEPVPACKSKIRWLTGRD